jgi:hypothetical protein
MFTILLGHVNWLSIIIATLSAFAIGGLWYSPVLFSKIWIKELKIVEKEIQKTKMILIFGVAFILEFISAIALSIVLGPQSTTLKGMFTGLFIGMFFIGTSFGINYLFAGKSLKLFFIDAGYYLVTFTVIGTILGAW